MDWFGKIVDNINRVIELIVIGMLAVMVVVVFLQVVFRFIIKSAIPWSEELARYLLVWITFLGSSIGIKKKSHIGVEAVVKIIPAKYRKIISIIANGLSMVFFTIMIIWGYKIIKIVNNQLSPAMQMPMSIPYSAIAISGTLMFLYSFYNLLVEIKGLKEGDDISG